MPDHQRKHRPESFQRLAAYKRVFLDEAGHFTPEAEAIVADLARFSGLLGKIPLEAMTLAAKQGQRELLAYILYQTGTSEEELMRQLKKLGELNNA